jgi:hypothetical protein
MEVGIGRTHARRGLVVRVAVLLWSGLGAVFGRVTRNSWATRSFWCNMQTNTAGTQIFGSCPALSMAARFLPVHDRVYT